MTSERAVAMTRRVVRKYPQYTNGQAYWAAKELSESATVFAVVARVEADLVSPYRCPGCEACGNKAASL